MSNLSDAERVATDEPLCDCCQNPCYPIKADWGGYFCGKCYPYVKRIYRKLTDVRTELAKTKEQHAKAKCDGAWFAKQQAESLDELASVTARLAAAEERHERLREADELLSRCESLARWVDSYAKNGQMRLHESDIQYCERIEMDVKALRTALDEETKG